MDYISGRTLSRGWITQKRLGIATARRFRNLRYEVAAGILACRKAGHLCPAEKAPFRNKASRFFGALLVFGANPGGRDAALYVRQGCLTPPNVAHPTELEKAGEIQHAKRYSYAPLSDFAFGGGINLHFLCFDLV